MLFVDDALVAHTRDDMEMLVDCFARAASVFSLKINIKETECLYQPVKRIQPPPEPVDTMMALVKCTDSRYLGVTVSSNARIGNASAAFCKLQDCAEEEQTCVCQGQVQGVQSCSSDNPTVWSGDMDCVSRPSSDASRLPDETPQSYTKRYMVG